MLIKEAEDSRVYTADSQGLGLAAGIYEVARVEAPQHKPYILNTIQQFFRPLAQGAVNLWAWLPNYPGFHAIFWEIRIDPIYSGQNRPNYLVAAASGIQGNPLPAWPRRDHAVEKMCLESASENRILVWGPSTVRFFATLTGVGDDPEFLQVGGRLALFSDYDDRSEYLRGDRYAIPKA